MDGNKNAQWIFTAANTILRTSHLTVSLEGRSIIRDLSFDIPSGTCVAIVGPNGSGKTVLLKTLLNLLPYQGEIHWGPGSRIGYVPQRVDADRRLPLNVHDLLLAKTRFLKLPHSALDEAASAAGITPELLQTGIGAVSGGQFQRVLIAFALLGRPTVLLVDEPTASLDELAEERVYELLHDLHVTRRITTILVSHDFSVVYSRADLVLCLGGGRPCFGPPREILTPDTLAALYSWPLRYFRHVIEHTKHERG
jgi:zinc transport system ATP-binding protein